MRVLIEIGATESFLLKSVALKLSLMLLNNVSQEVGLSNGQTKVIETVPRSVRLSKGRYKESIECRVICLARYKTIF